MHTHTHTEFEMLMASSPANVRTYSLDLTSFSEQP